LNKDIALIDSYNQLYTIWQKEYKDAGSPQTWCPNEPLFHALRKLKHVLNIEDGKY
jgi:hypothetical protein